MIKINTLYSLNDILDIYYITNDLKIINIKTGTEKKVTIDKRIYPYVTFETKIKDKNKKVQMHKIVALAFIKNNSYDIIEHKDNNKLNYSVDNLMFSTQKDNCKHASQDGLNNRIEKIFNLIYNDVDYRGTIKELHKQTNIPVGTLYDNLYNNRNNNITIFEGQTTIPMGVGLKQGESPNPKCVEPYI